MAINYLANMDRWKGFPFLINKFNLKIGIEIGIREGFHCKNLLENSSLEILYGLDKEPNMGYIRPLQAEYPTRFKLLLEHSPQYASNFEDNYFDFIHIDTWHTKEACLADIKAWWPKLKKGGLFTGDDFLPARDHTESRFGVDEAVESWSKNNNLEYFVTGCDAIDFENKYKYAEHQWTLLKDGVHESHVTFQIPQWWLFKE